MSDSTPLRKQDTEGADTTNWLRICEAVADRMQERHVPESETCHRPYPLGRRATARLAHRIANDLIENIHWELGTAVPIEQLAANLGYQIVYRPQALDGCLPRDPLMPILINSRNSAQRRRFTIAHEVAHAWLRTHPDALMMDPDDHARWREALCDSVAGHLLVPPRSLERLPGVPSLIDAMALSSAAKVSLQVVINRGVDTGRWRCQLLEWRPHETGLVARRLAGGPANGTGWRTEDPYTFRGLPVRGWTPVVVRDAHGALTPIEVQVGKRTPASVIVLVRASRQH